ncbi:hypothetical protein [Actinoplanes sp. N902-109]|uniref:hypothetical protein n=1 Tax=Actinoplanes sp. (strain N902-109) TaxID=649831 RepID=UPI0003294CD4|nr:hypothetical protein [Actinoplanes sp. N902-109]AGL19528.1 hypothetical protein L083_6018 [Actinoplanes sp. N902-109]
MGHRARPGNGRTPKSYARDAVLGRCRTCGLVTYLCRKKAREVARTVHPGAHTTVVRCAANREHWHIQSAPVEIGAPTS